MFEGLASPSHLLIIAVLFVVLFGAKRLPESARALGQSMRILKAETSGTGPLTAPPVARFDVHTGEPLPAPVPAPAAGPVARFDVHTGEPLPAAPMTPVARFDVHTGEPLPAPAEPDRT